MPWSYDHRKSPKTAETPGTSSGQGGQLALTDGGGKAGLSLSNKSTDDGSLKLRNPLTVNLAPSSFDLASQSYTFPKVDYAGLVNGRWHSTYLAFAASLIGALFTCTFVYARYIADASCEESTECLQKVAMKVFGFCLYAHCLLPKWHRSAKIERHDTKEDEDEYARWKMIISLTLVLSIVIFGWVIWLSLDKNAFWLFLPRSLWLHLCSYLFGGIAIFAPLAAAGFNLYVRKNDQRNVFTRPGYSALNGKSSKPVNSSLTHYQRLRQALPFPGEGLFLGLEVTIFAFAVVFWLIALSIKEDLMLCLEITCACVIITWVLLRVACFCLRDCPERSPEDAQELSGLTPQEIFAVFFFSGCHHPGGRLSDTAEVLQGDIVWGMKLLFYPLDCGNSLVVMVLKQLMSIAFCCTAIFSFWGHISIIRNSYSFQCLGPKGLAAFVKIPEDPLTGVDSPMVKLIEKICTAQGSDIVDTPFKFEYILTQEVGMLFSLSFLFVTPLVMWALLLYNYLTSSAIHPDIWDDCLYWRDPYANSFKGKVLRQLVPEQAMRALNAPLRARVYIKRQGEKKGKFVDIPKTPIGDDFVPLVAAIEAYYQAKDKAAKAVAPEKESEVALAKHYDFRGTPFAYAVQKEKQALALLTKSKGKLFENNILGGNASEGLPLLGINIDSPELEEQVQNAKADSDLMDDFVDQVAKMLRRKMTKVWWTSCLQVLLFFPVLRSPKTGLKLEEATAEGEENTESRIRYEDEFGLDHDEGFADTPRKDKSAPKKGKGFIVVGGERSVLESGLKGSAQSIFSMILNYQIPSIVVALVPLVLPGMLGAWGFLRDFPATPLFDYRLRAVHGEVPFAKYRFLAAIWMWYFTAAFLNEFVVALKSYFQAMQGYEYLTKLIAKDSALPFFLDIGGQSISITAQDIKNKKDTMYKREYEHEVSEADVKDNVLFWTVLRRYLRLVLVLPKAHLDGLLGVSMGLFLMLCLSSVAASLYGETAMSSLASAVMKTSEEIAFNLSLQTGHFAMQAQSDIAAATANATQQMQSSMTGASGPSSGFSGMAQTSIHQAVAPYGAQAISGLSDSIEGADYSKFMSGAMSTLESMRNSQLSTFSFSCIVYVILLGYYTLRALSAMAVVNGYAEQQADHLIAAQERSVTSIHTPELKERVDIAIHSTRSEGSGLLMKFCGKIVTVGVLIAALCVMAYPQSKKFMEHIPLVSADICRTMSNQSLFLEGQRRYHDDQILYNSSFDEAFSSANHMLSQSQDNFTDILHNSQTEVIVAITKCYLILSELSNKFDALSSNRYASLQSRMDEGIAVLAQKAMVHLELARNLVRETVNDAHAWVEGKVFRVATTTVGVVTQILDTTEDALKEFRTKSKKEVSQVSDELGGEASDELKKIGDEIDKDVTFLYDEVLKARIQLKKALIVAAALAHSTVEAAHTQVTILGRTLVNLGDEIKFGVNSKLVQLNNAFAYALQNVDMTSQAEIKNMQQAIYGKIEIFETVVARSAKTVAAEVEVLQSDVVDIAKDSKKKVKKIIDSLQSRVTGSLNKLAAAQDEIDESANQVFDTVKDERNKAFTMEAVGSIQGHLDTATSKVQASVLQIVKSLSSSESYIDAGTVKKAQDEADQLKNDMDKRIKTDLQNIKIAEGGIRQMMGTRGVEVFAFVTTKIKCFQKSVHDLIKQAHTTTADAFMVHQRIVMNFINNSATEGMEQLKRKVKNFEQAIMSTTHTTGAAVITQARKIIIAVETSFRNAVLTFSSSVSNMHVWADSTLVVADESISGIVATTNDKMEELVSEILVKKRAILSVVSPIDPKAEALENATQATHNGVYGANARKVLVRAIEECLAYLENLKIILYGALSSASSEGSHSKLLKLRDGVEMAGHELSNATKDLLDNLHFRQEMLKEYTTIAVRKAEGLPGIETLKQAMMYVKGNLSEVTEVVERGSAMAESAVGSAEAAENGVLNATAVQMETFIQSIIFGIDIAEEALLKKQRAVHDLLESARGKESAATINKAEQSFQSEFDDFQSDMRNTTASLNQVSLHVAQYASGNLTEVKDAVKVFEKKLEQGLEDARLKSEAAANEIHELLVEKTRMSKLLGKDSVAEARTGMTKSLDKTLVLSHIKIKNLTATITGGIESIKSRANGGTDSSFDAMASTLKSTLDTVRIGLDDLTGFMKARIGRAFQIMKTIVRKIAAKGKAFLHAVHTQVPIPPMNLQAIFDQYVCKPLTMFIIRELGSVNSTSAVGQNSPTGMESRNPAPTVALAKRRLAVSEHGDMTTGESLADAVVTWWQQEDHRHFSEHGAHAEPAQILARYDEVVAALRKLQGEIHVSQQAVAAQHYERFVSMHLGLTREAALHLKVLRESNRLLPADFRYQDLMAPASNGPALNRFEM